MRKFIAGLIASAIMALPLGFGVQQASASNLLGVPHTHVGTCPVNNCWTWILANGAVMRGDGDNLVAQYGYVLVVCSQRIREPNGFVHWIVSRLGPWGPFNNDGKIHPYCVDPHDGNGIRWNQYPLSGGA